MAPDLDEPDEPGAATNLPAEAEAAVVPTLTRIRVLVLAALGPLLAGYLAIAALLALVTGIATNARLAAGGVLDAALPSWLAAHQVPVRIIGLELGVLPLLPTIGVAAITARTAAAAAVRLDLRRPGQAGKLVALIAAAHGIAGMLVAGLSSRGDVTADPLSALYYPAVVSALAATAGVARRCGLLDAIVLRTDEVAVAGLRAGALAVVLLLAAGGALLTFGLLTSISTARDLFPMGAGNAIGMLLLSIGYLPNAMIAATAFLAGPGFSIGAVAVSPLEFDGGPVPALPLLAALPESAAAWWPALFALPLAVGVAVGRRLRDVDEDPVARLRAVAVASGVVAVAFVVLGGSAGGHLGRGPFDPVSMHAAALSVALVLWTVVPAAVTVWFGGPRPAAERLPGLLDDPEPVADEDAEPAGEQPEPAEAAADEPDVDADEEDEEPDEDAETPAELPGPRDAVEESGEAARD
ncbi:cell division protein PerM [Actinophytocola sp. KF-1]